MAVERMERFVREGTGLGNEKRKWHGMALRGTEHYGLGIRLRRFHGS